MEESEFLLKSMLSEAQAGSDSAIVRLFEFYRSRLRRSIALRMDRRLQGRVDPSDIVQEAFLDFQKRFEEFAHQHGVPFFLWLRSIACDRLHKVHRAHLEAQKRDVRREQPMQHPRELPAASMSIVEGLSNRYTSVVDRAIRDEIQSRLYQAIETMDETDREILAMRHFEDLSNKEISFLLGISPTAASNRYVRALQKLRDAMEGLSDSR